MPLKDSKLEEKEQFVVKGEILADSFRDRKTGKEIDKDASDAFTEDEVDELKTISEKVSVVDDVVKVDKFLVESELDGQLKNGFTITPAEGITIEHAYCEKLGDLYFLYIQLRNTSGVSIAGSTTLATLNFTPAIAMYMPCAINGATGNAIIKTTGEIISYGALNNVIATCFIIKKPAE